MALISALVYLYDERVKFMQALEKSLHFLT
jgi:hypothetical protein